MQLAYDNQIDVFGFIASQETPKKTEISKKLETNHIEKNKKILARYRMHCRSKGLTKESLKAIVDNDLKLFIDYIGNQSLESVKHTDIQDFLLYCEEERKNGDEAMARKFTSLNMFFKTLINQEVLDIKNPLNKLEKPKVRKKMRGHLTLEEYSQLLTYIDRVNDLRGGALISLFFSSGCRLSEIWQLNSESLDFQNRRFKVLGKGQKERMCVFSLDAKERILKYLDSRKDTFEWLFVSRQNNRWSKKSIQDYIKITGKRAGIKKHCHAHLLRHTRAMALLRKDVPLEVIQRLLGHSSIATTQVYARMDMDTVQNKIDAVDLK